MQAEELTYLAVLGASIPAGIVFHGGGPNRRRYGAAALGGAVALLTCGAHVLHSLLTVLGCCLLLRLLPRRCGAASMLWTFGYLLLFRTAPIWGLPPPPPYANALQLLLTLKLVSLAWDLQEELEAGPEVTSKAGKNVIGCPSVIDILCYSYCYLGLLTGPFYRFSTHRRWILRPPPPPPFSSVLLRLRPTPFMAAAGLAAAILFPTAGLRVTSASGHTSGSGPTSSGFTFGFEEKPVPVRFLHVAAVFFAFRMRFYVAWIGAEAACVAAGFGAVPEGANAKPGRGPEPGWEEKEGDGPPSGWDYSTIRNIDPVGTDFCVRFRDGMRHWNMTVQWWLAHYVHRKAPRNPPALRAAMTMLVSAYWHGLHPGYYLSFLSVPLWLAAESAAERKLGGGVLGGPVGRTVQWLLKMRAYEYLCIGFVLLGGGDTWRCWGAVGWWGHLVPLMVLGGCAVMGGGKREKGEGGGKEGE